MNTTTIHSGDELDSYCGKCKLERVHNVVALVGDAVAKVVCKTCGSQHRYKPGQTEPKKRVRATARKSSTSTLARQAMLWEKAMEENGDAARKPYSALGAFAPGDVIEHAQFGRGVVTEISAAGKMHVLFKDGPRRLIFNRAAPQETAA